MFQLIIMLIFHCLLWDSTWGLRKFVYQKDVSEYCRRRAVPSVFLGRRVVETNAQMLHFSNLDLPYSCFISIRTQSSNNIIMVVQLSPRSELSESCERYENQLTVHEFGETFGGYWGPLPKNLVNPDPGAAAAHKLYALRTTHSSKTTSETKTTQGTTKKPPTTWRPTEDDGFITVEVPLANLSGRLVPGDPPLENSFDIDDTFDLLYDVTPRKGESYETSILPLVQFSLRRQEGDGRSNEDGEPRYELDYNLGTFTPDYRLTLPVLSTRKILNRNRNLWKLKKFPRYRAKPHASNAPLFTTEAGMLTKPFRKNNVSPTSRPRHEITEKEEDAAKVKINDDSLALIEHIMKSLNKSENLYREVTELPRKYVQVIRNISDMHHNFSAYLAPWPMYTYLPLSKLTVNYTEKQSSSTSTPRVTTEAITKLRILGDNNTEQSIRVNEELNSTKVQEDISDLTQSEKDFDDISVNNIDDTLDVTMPIARQELLQVTTPSGINSTAVNSLSKLADFTDTYVTAPLSAIPKDATHASTAPLSAIPKDATHASTTTKRSLGSLVDHESWENVVQSAPVMAVLLHQHAPNETHNATVSNKTHDAPGIDRKYVNRLSKRHIETIPVDPARPHAHYTKRPRARTRPPQFADIQDFAKLVELPDDELSGHVALRFMRQYAGPVLFNICDTNESVGYKLRHVVLFNSSRIILALGNFSVSRMTVVLTTGKALASQEATCAQDNIECQIGGSRVCIDSSSACDGVPNCGAHDIYDEDRLRCGGAMGLQHNVVLATITFLAVLLTVVYIVHYWLKRCVPKVAEAFFIYTDSAENVLFLDSIMRSPTDADNASKLVYPDPATYFEENMNLYEEITEKSFLEKCSTAVSKLNFWKNRKKSCELTETGDLQVLNTTRIRKMYSFTAMEISKMIGTSTVDEEVQTTESLEMAFLKLINMYKKTIQSEAPGKDQPRPPTQKDAYQRLELFSPAESSFEEPGPSSRNVAVGRGHRVSTDERELRSTVYEPESPGTVRSEASKTKETCASEGTVNSKKCLRFDDQATFIAPQNDQSVPDVTDAQDQFTRRQSVVLGTGSNKLVRRNINSLETISQDSERTGTDFRSFFMGKKSKKKKNQK